MEEHVRRQSVSRRTLLSATAEGLWRGARDRRRRGSAPRCGAPMRHLLALPAPVSRHGVRSVTRGDQGIVRWFDPIGHIPR